MAFKLIALTVMTACIVLQTQAAATKQYKERVAALYVKDGSSGELRFLGGGQGNSQINQYITNKQDLLEQLRPTLDADDGIINPDDIMSDIDTTFPDTVTEIGSGAANAIGTIGGVRPIIINAGGNGGTLNPNFGAALQQRRGPNRRRAPNRRRVNRRRPARRGGVKRNGNKQGQIYVIRQRA